MQLEGGPLNRLLARTMVIRGREKLLRTTAVNYFCVLVVCTGREIVGSAVQQYPGRFSRRRGEWKPQATRPWKDLDDISTDPPIFVGCARLKACFLQKISSELLGGGGGRVITQCTVVR